jgi:SAM-dependent methyltransferase
MTTWYQTLLQCPDCGGELTGENHLVCQDCGYQSRGEGGRDLRPRSPSDYELRHRRVLAASMAEQLCQLEVGPPPVTYDGPAAKRDSSELLSEVTRYAEPGAAVLDLGCGPCDQATPMEYLGYRYVGVDYSGAAADLLADAHALPFRPASFDVVFSYAVLEHLHHPFVAVSEIVRVLKPGGVYVGTVSQGEPFHDSYFHHTAWGVLSVATSQSGLEVRRLWATGDTLFSLARMGRYPRIIRMLLRALATLDRRAPWLAPRRARWPAAQKRVDALYRAGSLGFVMQKTAG